MKHDFQQKQRSEGSRDDGFLDHLRDTNPETDKRNDLPGSTRPTVTVIDQDASGSQVTEAVNTEINQQPTPSPSPSSQPTSTPTQPIAVKTISPERECDEAESRDEGNIIRAYRTQDESVSKTDIETGKYLPPAKATPHSSGYDIRARLLGTKFGGKMVIRHGETNRVPTGFSFDIPFGYELQVRPRSGLASKGIMVANAPGTTDADYKDEVMVIIHNTSGSDFIIEDGDRVAQLVFAKTEYSEMKVGNIANRKITEDRGGGFGHTGIE